MDLQDDNRMKVDKYDRQIRLWGARGQRKLGTAKVALVNCTGAGIEALKNLVLPGIGFIDIWDDTVITVQDLSSSFFFEHENVGQPKAEIASKNLLQLNPDVHGSYFSKNLSQFLEDSNAIKGYSLVIIGGEIGDKQIQKTSQILWNFGVPCIFITIAGYFFYVRTQKQIHFVQSSNTSAKKYYLRISDPFPQLAQYTKQNSIYAKMADLQNKNEQELKEQYKAISHIPYVLILIDVIEHLPKENRKRNAIQQQLNRIKQLIPFQYKQNIEQALKNIFDALQTPQNYMIDIGLLSCEYVKKCNKDSHLMCKFLYATQQIHRQTRKLPQPTGMPDMHTTTENFIQLKKIYKLQHEADIIKICEIIKASFGEDQVDKHIISDYINNLQNLQLVHTNKYSEELQKPEVFNFNYGATDKDIYVAIRAYQQLINMKEQQSLNMPYEQFKKLANQLQLQYKIDAVDERYLKEVHRSKGRSDINIYSIAGALVGQQAIKLITGCFTPMNSGYLFDGANGRGFQVKL